MAINFIPWSAGGRLVDGGGVRILSSPQQQLRPRRTLQIVMEGSERDRLLAAASADDPRIRASWQKTMADLSPRRKR